MSGSGFGQLNNAQLGSLLLELAMQLHVERTRRLALEAVLAQRGILVSSELDDMGNSPALRAEAEKAGDVAIRKLLRTLSESSDERIPLRAEAPGATGGR